MNVPDTAFDSLRQDLESALDKDIPAKDSAFVIKPDIPAKDSAFVIKPANGKLDELRFGEVEGYLRNGERMLQLARKRLIDVDALYRKRRGELVNKLSDDLAKLDHEHEADVLSIRDIITRLEAMRHG